MRLDWGFATPHLVSRAITTRTVAGPATWAAAAVQTALRRAADDRRAAAATEPIGDRHWRAAVATEARLGGVVGGAALQLANAVAERFAQLRQLARAEDHQHDRQDEDEVRWF